MPRLSMFEFFEMPHFSHFQNKIKLFDFWPFKKNAYGHVKIHLSHAFWGISYDPGYTFYRNQLSLRIPNIFLFSKSNNVNFQYEPNTWHDGTSTSVKRSSNELIGIFHLRFHHIRVILYSNVDLKYLTYIVLHLTYLF